MVTQDVIQSQQAHTITDALQNVSGVTISPGGGGSAVQIRGFTAPVMTDGLSNSVGGNLSAQSNTVLTTPMAAVSQIEVLKGADAILAGPMDPGGVVNLVKKRPQADPVRELTMQIGPYGDLLSSLRT